MLKNDNELVSIVMPSYNTGEFILESIKSVLKQTYSNWELIIVDDCSNDNTEKLVKSIPDDRIIFLKNDINCGAALSRNRALREAKGKWIAFLDSDDIWSPNKLEKQIDFMKKKNCYFSYTKYCEIDSNSQLLNVVVSGPKKINKKAMFKYCWMGCLTVMYDADYIGLIQIEDLKKNNDYAMWLQICKKAVCYLLDENLGMYRKRTGSISNQSKIKLIKYHYVLFRKGINKSIICSIWFTLGNIFWGIYKKIKYTKKLNDKNCERR